MMVSTKGRYALRVMIDMAKHSNGTFIPLSDVATRQNISEKYLESIVASLARHGLLTSVRGKGGGYKLNRDINEYTVSDILKATEGSIAPVACLSKEINDCPNVSSCPTLKMWQGLQELIEDYFSKITLEQLISDSNDCLNIIEN